MFNGWIEYENEWRRTNAVIVVSDRAVDGDELEAASGAGVYAGSSSLVKLPSR